MTRLAVARAGGLGALAGLTLLPAALTAVGCAVVGAAVLAASRAAAGPSPDAVAARLGPEHDDAVGSAVRRQHSWLSTALLVGLLPLPVALLMPRLEPGIRDRPLTPAGQYTGRLVLAVVLAVLSAVTPTVGGLAGLGLLTSGVRGSAADLGALDGVRRRLSEER